MIVQPKTIMEYCGESENDNCGYCKDGNSLKLDVFVSSQRKENKYRSAALSLISHQSSNEYFMRLLEGGWSSSGKYMYKPNNELTCCPQYSIRLDVTKFFLSRSQKRALRQMNQFLANNKKPKSALKEESSTLELEKKVESTKKNAEKENLKERPIIKKKEIRKKKFEQKCRDKNIDLEEVKKNRREKEEARRRTIESFILEEKDNWLNKLEVKVVSTKSDEYMERDKESFELYKKYQTIVHKDEQCRLAGYRRFLCETPMEIDEKDSTESITFGSYHIRFILNGSLIAVSVIDILPRCLSAKYMFYDPDYSFLSLGTYTALREIEETRKLSKINSDLKYYYMGYYIHSCPKMRYKAKFRPSDLLCDQSMEWVDFEICKEILNKAETPNGYSVFRNDLPRPRPMNVESMLLISKRTLYTWKQYCQENPEIRNDEDFLNKIKRLSEAIGPNLPNAMYYFNELN